MSNREVKIGIIALGAVIGGVISFFFLKFYELKPKTIAFKDIMSEAFLVVLMVTFVMYFGSWTTYVFTHLSSHDTSEWSLLLHSTALTFLVESMIVLIWNAKICQWQTKHTYFRTAIKWLGFFVIFTLFNTVFVQIYDGTRGAHFAISWKNLQHLPEVMMSTIGNAVYIVTEPIHYIQNLWSRTHGNQFLLARDFPTWSIFFFSSAFCLSLGQSFVQITKSPGE